LQSDLGLVHSDASEEPFNRGGEIGPLRTSHDAADGVFKPQPEARD